MTTESITVHKGSVSKKFDLGPNMKVREVRTILENRGFICKDNSKETWRFFIYKLEAQDDKEIAFNDAILAKATEEYVPIPGMYGLGGQLYLTNIAKTKNPDLMGIGTNWFFDQFMSCKVSLNMNDASAKARNKGKFQPMMITNVKPTSREVGSIYNNVVVCEKGSSVAFNISSWGAAGFGYSIRPDSGQKIVGGLYVSFDDKQNREGSSYVYRYQDKAQQILIDSTKDLKISNGRTVACQRVRIKTWRVTSYKKGGTVYTSNAQPPGALAGAGAGAGGNAQRLTKAEVIPGDAITPAAPHPGDDSKQKFGTISKLKQDDKDGNGLGEVIVYFFVFKSKEDAVKVIDQINAPDPSVWT